jgi:hypothetical protein
VTFPIIDYNVVWASQALVFSRTGTGLAAWVAIGALEVGFIAALVLLILAGTLPTKGY